MSENKRNNEFRWNFMGAFWNNPLISALVVIVIIVLLQPFKIDEIEKNKYLIIMGYGILTFFSCIFTKLVTYYIFHIDKNNYSLKETLIGGIIITLVMGFLVTCYASYIYTGNIYNGWHIPDGTFVLSAFWVNCGYALIITFFVEVFLFFFNRNKELAQRLKVEVELNRIINERAQIKQNSGQSTNNEQETGHHEITLIGSTKETVKLDVENLPYIESNGNYADITFLQNEQKTKKTLRCTLKQLENNLADFPQIIRCHRAFLVNIQYIIHVEGNAQGYRLKLQNTVESIPVSRAYATEVYQRIESKQ